MTAIIWLIIFLVSIIILLKSSDYFTAAAEKVGIILGMSPFIVGVTIVAIGTSLPELVASIFAMVSGSSEIIIGNVLGSNIANILLILGLLAIIGKMIDTKYTIIRVDLPILMASAFFILITCYDGIFNIWEGIIGLIAAIYYLWFAASTTKPQKEEKAIQKEMKKENLPKQFIIIFITAILIFISAKYTVDSVIKLSEIFNIGKEVIAISAVALGTSLPELFVGISAVKRKKGGMVFGNILGSNIMNSFAIMGIPSLFGAIIIPRSLILFSIPVMVGATLLFVFMTQERHTTKWEGMILMLGYILYIAKIFNLF